MNNREKREEIKKATKKQGLRSKRRAERLRIDGNLVYGSRGEAVYIMYGNNNE